MTWPSTASPRPGPFGPGLAGTSVYGDGAPVGGGSTRPVGGGQPPTDRSDDVAADVPSAPQPGGPTPDPYDPPPGPVLRMAEGLRGLSTRTTVYLRYVGYLLAVVLASSVTQWAMSGSIWRNGGMFMFFASVLMVVTAAAGTWFYTNHRNEVLEQLKHYLFGITVVPGTALALLYRAAQSIFASPAARADAFLSTLANALPILMFATVVIPAALFVKVVAGLRNLHRSRLDDQEAMQTYARIDPWMR